jgi:hypothetical protein
MDPRFQTTPGGYIWDPKRRRRYAAGRGFLATVPCFGQVDIQDPDHSRLVPFLEMAARLPAARETAWFARSLAYLSAQPAPDRGAGSGPRGAVRWSSSFLRETEGYYLYAGLHMGLGENRRRRQALTLESTFRLLLIRKLASQPRA